MAVVAALMWLVARNAEAPGPALRFGIAGAVALAALAIALSAVVQFARAGTTLNPHHAERSSRLVTGGVFAWSRNPMYLSLALLLLALALALGSPFALAGPVVFVAYITRFQILPEERALAHRFGAEFDAYRRRVRRWI